MVKEQYRESSLGHRISHVCFGMQSAQEVERAAHLQVKVSTCYPLKKDKLMKYWLIVKVVGKNLYNQDAERTPIPFGALDNRMGTSQKVLYVESLSFPHALTQWIARTQSI